MHAEIDDELVVRSHRLDEPAHRGRILETRGPDGSPPYLVQWDDSGHTALVFPGADADVVAVERRPEEHRA